MLPDAPLELRVPHRQHAARDRPQRISPRLPLLQRADQEVPHPRLPRAVQLDRELAQSRRRNGAISTARALVWRQRACEVVHDLALLRRRPGLQAAHDEALKWHHGPASAPNDDCCTCEVRGTEGRQAQRGDGARGQRAEDVPEDALLVRVLLRERAMRGLLGRTPEEEVHPEPHGARVLCHCGWVGGVCAVREEVEREGRPGPRVPAALEDVELGEVHVREHERQRAGRRAGEPVCAKVHEPDGGYCGELELREEGEGRRGGDVAHPEGFEMFQSHGRAGVARLLVRFVVHEVMEGEVDLERLQAGAVGEDVDEGFRGHLHAATHAAEFEIHETWE